MPRQNSTRLLQAAALPLALVVAGCGSGATVVEEPPRPPTRKAGSGSADYGKAGSTKAAATKDADNKPAGDPSSVGPIDMEAHGLAFRLPESWSPLKPTSSMRAAQASIPGPAGAAEMVVFFFGVGGGGEVTANLDRWEAQVKPDEGTTPQRETIEQGDVKIHLVDTRGTLVPSGMGMGPSEPQPDQRLLAAVVEGEGGPWFFKATGPAATLEAQRGAFVEMLKTSQPGTGTSVTPPTDEGGGQ